MTEENQEKQALRLSKKNLRKETDIVMVPDIKAIIAITGHLRAQKKRINKNTKFKIVRLANDGYYSVRPITTPQKSDTITLSRSEIEKGD